MKPLLAILVLFCAAGCASHYSRGSVNDVHYDMSLDREAVPGGVPYSIKIQMDSGGDGTTGVLWVDGVSYGEVRSGDRVRVDDDAVVRVNGVERRQQ